mmetsp:Transcript_1664/g.4446  ORF Transcript_1664/g.4446 Transcript_1664/m.4446 type:complete len:237 (-) Transcript_1664:221-931(-)
MVTGSLHYLGKKMVERLPEDYGEPILSGAGYQRADELDQTLCQIEKTLYETTQVADTTADQLFAQGAQLDRVNKTLSGSLLDAKLSRKLLSKVSFWKAKPSYPGKSIKKKRRGKHEAKIGSETRRPKLNMDAYKRSVTERAHAPERDRTRIPSATQAERADLNTSNETGKYSMLEAAHDESLCRIEELLNGLHMRAKEFGEEARAQGRTMDSIEDTLEQTHDVIRDNCRRANYLLK